MLKKKSYLTVISVYVYIVYGSKISCSHSVINTCVSPSSVAAALVHCSVLPSAAPFSPPAQSPAPGNNRTHSIITSFIQKGLQINLTKPSQAHQCEPCKGRAI